MAARTADEPPGVYIDFDDSALTDNYRVTLQTTAAPPVQLAEQMVTESDATFTGLTPATAFQVIVTARNSGGESLASNPIAGVVP